MNAELVESFRAEMLDLVGALEASLLALEAAGGGERASGELLGDAFRYAHSLKAAAAMLGLKPAVDAAHALESALDEVRGGGALDRGMITRLLAGVDALRTLARAMGEGDAPEHDTVSPPRDLLLRLQFAEDALVAGSDPLTALRTAGALGAVISARTDARRLPPLGDLDPARLYLGFELVLRTSAGDDEIRRAFASAEGYLELEITGAPACGGVPSIAPPPDDERAARRDGLETLAVSVRRVDTLVDLAAEMSVAVSRLERRRGGAAAASDPELDLATREIRQLASKLQEAAMAIRLVPLSATFAMLQRFVRDQALRLGKRVLIAREGAQTELDKSVGERLLDPLKHLVRNALDHGIERADERARAGKPAEGRITLSARQEQGAVVLTVEDDGRGIDRERVRAAAAQKGLIKPDAVLSEAEALELVFQPGFSTADAVSELSGRGVGLDVVRRNLLELGGAIRVESEVGVGTRFTLSVPLTLALLDGLVMRCGGERLVVPMDRVAQLLRPSPGQIVRLPEDREILRLPERSVPLLRPSRLFGGVALPEKASAVAVVLETNAGAVALYADDVLSQEAVMLKPLQRSLKIGVDGVLGATVLGDGGVALVLDVARLGAFQWREPEARPFMSTNSEWRG